MVYGDDPSNARQAETAILGSLIGARGLRPLDANSVAMMRGDRAAIQVAAQGDFGGLAALGRDSGAELLVVGVLTSRARPSVGRFFTGTAELDVKMYRVSTRSLVNARTFRVGSGDSQAVLATTDVEARVRAAREVGDQAASAVRGWVAGAFR